MPLIDTPDGRYTYAIETPNSGLDGNSVVYDNWRVPGEKTPVWDRLSYEASLGQQPPPPEPIPAPIPPSTSHLRFTQVQLTNANDSITPAREYSYWPHACLVGNDVFVFICSSQGHPPFFRVDADGTITRLGPMIPYASEGEGWYWSRDGWVYLIDGPRLRRVSPFNGQDQVILDISGQYPNHNLWQAHSSDDGTVHCATVRQNSNDFNPHVKTVIAHRNGIDYVPVFGQQDESHITADGRYCIIEEDNNNRIVDVSTGREQLILDADGALSHIDCGPSYMVGEDNINGRAWRIDLPTLQRTELEQTWGMGHVSVQAGRCLLSNAGSLLWMDVNGGGLAHVLDHGMVPLPGQDAYDFQVKANLDATATVAVYMTNHGGAARQEVMLANVVALPNQLAVKPRLDSAIRSHHRRHAPRLG